MVQAAPGPLPHHHPRSQLALGLLPQRTMKLFWQLKRAQYQKQLKKALTGLAEFGNSGASAGNNLIVHTHHHLTYAVIRVPLIAG
uniref:Uncharacterized protein n=1 Tax=Amphimedon queenslandica TaxID=400682 RepID=A0A1X7SV18_AMPQE